jgi:hypothetical protein
MVVKSSTSLTLATSVANTSLPSLKVRYCRVSVISVTLIVSSFRMLKASARQRRRWSRLETLEFLVQVIGLLLSLSLSRRLTPRPWPPCLLERRGVRRSALPGLAGRGSTCLAGFVIAVRTVAVCPSSPVRKKASALTSWSDWPSAPRSSKPSLPKPKHSAE